MFGLEKMCDTYNVNGTNNSINNANTEISSKCFASDCNGGNKPMPPSESNFKFKRRVCLYDGNRNENEFPYQQLHTLLAVPQPSVPPTSDRQQCCVNWLHVENYLFLVIAVNIVTYVFSAICDFNRYLITTLRQIFKHTTCVKMLKNAIYTDNSSFIDYFSKILNGRFILWNKIICRRGKRLIDGGLSVLGIIAILLVGFVVKTEADVCWIQQESNGKCSQLYMKNLPRDECCKIGNEFAYTKENVTEIMFFFNSALGGGSECTPCMQNCDQIKCGTGKRCVMRNGRPKCICSPLCRSSSKDKSEKKLPIRVIDIGKQSNAMQLVNFNSMIIKRQVRSLSREIFNASAGNDLRKSNQRKLKTTKSRYQLSQMESMPGLMVTQKRHENSVKRKKKKNMTMNGRNIITIDSTHSHNESQSTSTRPSQSQSQPHHSRHQYKKNNKHDNVRKHKSKDQSGLADANRHPKRIYHDGADSTASVAIPAAVTAFQRTYHRGRGSNDRFPYPPNDLTKHKQLFQQHEQQQHALISHQMYSNPVCGTDGRTYKTECQLKKRACRQDDSTLSVAYRGHCQTSCKSVKCVNNLSCVEDLYGRTYCIECIRKCPLDGITDKIDPSQAVCGMDGRTYKSTCDIQRMICLTGKSVGIAYEGPCKDEATCSNIICGPQKVCLTDLATLKPRCMSCRVKCARKRQTSQALRYDDKPFCGKNNQTYFSWCQMKRDSCRTGFYIDMQHVGGCHRDSFSVNFTTQSNKQINHPA